MVDLCGKAFVNLAASTASVRKYSSYEHIAFVVFNKDPSIIVVDG